MVYNNKSVVMSIPEYPYIVAIIGSAREEFWIGDISEDVSSRHS